MSDVGVGVIFVALSGLCALAAVVISRRRRVSRAKELRRKLGSTARVIASDTGVLPPVPMRDSVLGLCGRPDYLMLIGTPAAERVSPLEVKPSRKALRLYVSDELQIAAYLVLTRAHFSAAAAEVGFVRYATRAFEVRLTQKLEDEVRRVVYSIRNSRLSKVLHRSHNSPSKCSACPMRGSCDEAL